MERGFHLSFTGSITYAKGQVAEILRVVPKDRLLLETDAPWMTPVPYRGRRNEPAYVVRVAETLAAKLGRDVEAVVAETNAAAGRLFAFPAEPPVATRASA